MNPGDIRQMYFIGVGGIGMSALARYFHSKGVQVSGYDRTVTPLTRALEAEGIRIHYEDKVELAPKDVDLVVYTPAIPSTHSEYQYYLNNGYTVVKRSEVLEWISESSFNICVAGTHGKTTTSTLVAHLLRDSGYGCNAFLGGIAANYETNFWSDEKNVCVIEADEYDRSFLKLSPDIAVITSMDPDHLDIYGTGEEVEAAFIAFSRRRRPGGMLYSRYGLKRSADLGIENWVTYGLFEKEADVYVTELNIRNGVYQYTVKQGEWELDKLELFMGGLHNVENSVVSIAIAHQLGISDDKIRTAVSNFKGVKRRFEYIVNKDPYLYIDDYAHHPGELGALIGSVKNLFPGKQCTVIFQPHLYSRTRDFADGFAESLNLADEVLLLPIYPAREKPIEGVESAMILERMNIQKTRLIRKEEVVDWIRDHQADLKNKVLITAGAGDIDQLVLPLKKTMESF